MKIGKKLKENWLGFIVGVALTYFVGPQVGLPVIQKAIQAKPVAEEPAATGTKVTEPGGTLTDSEPSTIINNERKKK